MDENIPNYILFENLCVKLFKSFNFKVDHYTGKDIHDKLLRECDLILEKDGLKIVVDVKFYKTKKPDRINLEHATRQLDKTAEQFNTPNKLLIINCKLDSKFINEIKETYKLEILTSENLLYLSKESTELYNEFLSIINSAIINNEKTTEVKPDISFLESMFYPIKDIIKKPEEECSCKELLDVEKSKGKIYEEKCTKILHCLFNEDLTRWSKQERTDDDLSRFDLVCRVNKQDNAFWNLIINEFNSRYIIFEFKNYKDQIKQTQIYTTEKYLFQRALRNVAFIISREGADDNAIKVTKGILRETGKLIINLTDQDLCEMLKYKKDGREPTDILFDIVDDFLLKMEK